MLRDLNGLRGRTIHATDGELGTVDDFYFDDKTWDIRYAVVRTGSWLAGRKALISAALLKREPDWRARTLPVLLTREQVRNSPDTDTQKTVTRLHEEELHKHYSWPIYWGESFLAGSMSGGTIFPSKEEAQESPQTRPKPESHLQSARVVTGYRLHAADGAIGHVHDYIVDDKRWAIRYLVAATGTWLPGRKVLISPHWIERVDWETSEVFVDLTRLAIRESPPYDPDLPVSADYESGLYDHYGRPKLEKAARGQGRAGAGR